MKKAIFILTIALAGLLGQSAWATNSFSTDQSIYSAAPGQSVQIQMLVTANGSTPTFITGTDITLQALKNQNSVSDISNLFTVTDQTMAAGWTSANAIDWPNYNDGGPYGSDALTASHSTHGSQYVETSVDLGGAPSSQKNTPFSNFRFETLTLTIAANAPAGTYNFDTAAPSGTNDGHGSHISSGSPNNPYYIPDQQAMFQITVVPEPATISLFGLGALGAVGIGLIRARRKDS